jgi:hypothetical protein
MPVTNLETMARAADALGMEREKKGDALVVKLRWRTWLRLRTEGGPVRSETRVGWKPEWLQYMSLFWLLCFFLSLTSLYRSPMYVVLTLCAFADLAYGAWKTTERKRMLFRKAEELSG